MNKNNISDPASSGEVEGIVTEALPNTKFRVDISGKEVLVYLAGKMRIHRIKVLVGDRVRVLLDQHGTGGRITRRF